MLETIREKLKNLKGLIVADPAKMLNHRNMCYGDDDLCLTLWPNTKLPNAIWFNRGGMEKSVVALKKLTALIEKVGQQSHNQQSHKCLLQ